MAIDIQNNDSAHEKPLPILAMILAYGFCPVAALVIGYCLWHIVEFVTNHVQTAQASFLSDLVLLIIAFITLVACAAFASWRFAIHLMEQKSEVKSAGMQRRIRYHEDMLRLIADNVPNILFIADKEGRFWFANREAAQLMRCETSEVVGKTIDRVFTQRSAAMLKDRIRRAQSVQAPVITVDRYDDATGPRYMETYHVPLPDSADLQKTVLVTQKDITAVIVERERQEQTFKQLIDTLIAVVDRRDPYAAGHSIRVGSIAQAIASQMGLDEQTVEASQIAGSLMNLGKILVSRSILIKTTALDTEELKLVRKAILTSADILSLISFQVPVIPTLRQVLERYDGKGVPEGRRGDNILISARIVSVANAFIALVSPRAHRAGRAVSDAVDILRKDIGTVFDGRVVEALATYMQTHPDVSDSLVKPPGELKGIVIDEDLLKSD
jgi:PAS domain S-box-containing protein